MKLIINTYLFVFSITIFSQNLNDSYLKSNVQFDKFNLKANENVFYLNTSTDLQASKQSIFSIKEIFNEKTLNLVVEKNNFYSLIDLHGTKQSIGSNKEIFNEKMLNVQFEKFNFKISEKKIDFNRFMFNCGVLEPISSKEMMISAFKYYILNKYVLSLFAKTDYN